jgi:TolB-like protein/Flp pilus assembly protein TadD
MVGERPDRVERRLAAILAADVAGYSRLMGIDEAGTARALNEHRAVTDALVAKHGGRIVKTTGRWPIDRVSSVVDAVECAVSVQTVMAERNADVPEERRMLFRVGINLGDVLVRGDDILGDGVNVAARLEAMAESGGICISASAYDQVRGKVAIEFADMGEQSLKNIARPVQVYRVVRDGVGASAAVASSAAPRLSIVVLPFANIGGDPEQEYFVDGVTESLTTDLSRISGSFVIARNTAFAYKGKPIDVKQIGRELGVRYALEGSVQRGGNRLRVNVQLIDADGGAHLWAERFDKPVADLFDMQDEIVARLAGQLGTELIEVEARRADRSPLPDSMDLYFQGTACWHKGVNPETLAQARGYFERALALDSNNIEALAGEALVDVMIGGGVMSEDRVIRIAGAEAAANQVLSVAPNHALAHYILGFVLVVTNRAAQGVAECEHALALDRNLSTAHAMIGLAKSVLGRAEETEDHVREALRLSPRDITANSWMHLAGGAKLVLGRDQEAVPWLRRSIEANRNYPLAHFYLATALVHLDRLEEARASVQTGLVLDPTFTIRRYRAGASSDNPTYLAQREHIYDGMRLAGVPEE